MSEDTPKKKLPITGYDGEQIIDVNGIVWEYNAEDNVWVYKGIIAEPDVVTAEEAGIITSATHQKLLLIQDLMEKGTDFSQFKLKGGAVNPYFYFFYSPDDFINFIPEAKNRLRVELDRNALYAKLVRNCCPGAKGTQGDKGLSGKDGVIAPNEVVHTPIIEGNNLLVDVDVPTPLDTLISLRIFGVTELVDIRLPLGGTDGPTIEVKSEDVEIDGDATELLFSDDHLSGVVVFTSGIELASTYKARQVGRTGEDGEDGNPFLVVEEQIIDDPAIRSQNAVLSMRKTAQGGIAYHKSSLYDQICAHNLALLSGDIPMGGILDAKFLAVLPSPNSCKEICFSRFETCSSLASGGSSTSQLDCDQDPDVIVDPLDLPEWTPTDSCYDLARCDQLQFDWHKIANDPYPWKILDDPCPPEQCCQQDFFWCPNVGDEPCGIDGEIKAPKRKLKPICPCPCPKETEDDLLADGVEFPLLDANKKMGYASVPEHPEVGHNDEDPWVRECNVTNIRESEISRDRRQAPDLYVQPVKVAIPIPIPPPANPFGGDATFVPSKITITIGLLNPDHECPDTPTKPGYLDPCPFHNIIIAEVQNEAVDALVSAVAIWPSRHQEIQITEEKEKDSVIFWVAGHGTVHFNCWVNTTELFCCRSYFIWTKIEPAVGPPIEAIIPLENLHFGSGFAGGGELDGQLGSDCTPLTRTYLLEARLQDTAGWGPCVNPIAPD